MGNKMEPHSIETQIALGAPGRDMNVQKASTLTQDTSVFSLQKIQSLHQTDKGLVLTQSVLNEVAEDAFSTPSNGCHGMNGNYGMEPADNRTRITSLGQETRPHAISISARSISQSEQYEE